jgi:hypothetical protein
MVKGESEICKVSGMCCDRTFGWLPLVIVDSVSVELAEGYRYYFLHIKLHSHEGAKGRNPLCLFLLLLEGERSRGDGSQIVCVCVRERRVSLGKLAGRGELGEVGGC